MDKLRRSVKNHYEGTSKVALVAFFLIFLLTFIAFINTIIIGDWVKIGLAFSAMILYEVPDLVSHKFKVHLPTILEITYYLFVFAGLVLGEVFAFYGPFPFWDIILHLLSGFVCAGIGLSLVEIMNKRKLSNLFTIIFAFCFSITLGVMWECLEFTFDITARTDAQKDAVVQNISTITMQRDGGNRPVRVDNIVKTEMFLLEGDVVTVDDGYLDIGLMDTMKDLFVNMAGAVLFCILGVFYLKNEQKSSFANNFIVRKNKSA